MLKGTDHSFLGIKIKARQSSLNTIVLSEVGHRQGRDLKFYFLSGNSI